MLQDASDVVFLMIVDIFNEVAQPVPQTPKPWGESRIWGFIQEGGWETARKLPPNHAIDDPLQVFQQNCEREVQSVLDAARPIEQAGSRAGFSVDDHQISMLLLVEKLKRRICLSGCTPSTSRRHSTL